jgi:zinc/manganese transport system ATP-binding protein
LRGLDHCAALDNGILGDAMTAQIEFHNLTLGYDRHPAVHHLNGAIVAGSLTAVVGPNGAGKSTLFKGIVGVIKPLAGRIEHKGLRARDIAYLPQAAEIDRSFPISVYDMIALGLWDRKGFLGGIGRLDHRAIETAISAVGLSGFEQRPIGTLSGGQMQRMLFARLLLQDARLIVLDEPFSAIDAKTCADLIELVMGWHWEGRTILTAMHDLELVKEHFPDTLLLAREPVAWGKTAQVLTAENLAKARHMCEAFDENAEACVVEAA